jgi:hypothetical protein
MLGNIATEARLGKIERFLLLYMISQGIWSYQMHARSCALQAYYRENHGLSLRQKRNVRQVIPLPEYKSLQVRFTKAMQRLASKGYIETYRVRSARWYADRGRGPEPADWRDGRLYIDGVKVIPLYTHVCCRRYRVVYRLTKEGLGKAYALIWSR